MGRKLAALSTIGLLVALVIGGVSFTSVVRIKSVSDLRSALAAVDSELTRLDTLISDAQIYERDMLMADNDRGRQKALDDLAATRKAADGHWARIDRLDLPPDLHESLAKIHTEYRSYLQVITATMPIFGELGVTSRDALVALARVQQEADKVRAQIRPARAHVNAREDAARAATDHRIVAVKRTVLISGCTGLAALLIPSLLITQSITRRLRHLRLRMAEIAETDGDFTARLSETATDETGDVARAANRFIARADELNRNERMLRAALDERDALARQLHELAFHDSLTGLANRAFFVDQLDRALAVGDRTSATSLAVMLVDLDDFKPVNDGYGHEAGDIVLCEVGQRLRQCIRDTDTVARLGGDEFALLLVEPAAEAVNAIANRIVETIAAPYWVGGQWVGLGASVGVVVSRGDQDRAELLRVADNAMYVAKSRGKGAFEIVGGDYEEWNANESGAKFRQGQRVPG